jgi:hypothetical protein
MDTLYLAFSCKLNLCAFDLSRYLYSQNMHTTTWYTNAMFRPVPRRPSQPHKKKDLHRTHCVAGKAEMHYIASYEIVEHNASRGEGTQESERQATKRTRGSTKQGPPVRTWTYKRLRTDGGSGHVGVPLGGQAAHTTGCLCRPSSVRPVASLHA